MAQKPKPFPDDRFVDFERWDLTAWSRLRDEATAAGFDRPMDALPSKVRAAFESRIRNGHGRHLDGDTALEMIQWQHGKDAAKIIKEAKRTYDRLPPAEREKFADRLNDPVAVENLHAMSVTGVADQLIADAIEGSISGNGIRPMGGNRAAADADRAALVAERDRLMKSPEYWSAKAWERQPVVDRVTAIFQALDGDAPAMTSAGTAPVASTNPTLDTTAFAAV